MREFDPKFAALGVAAPAAGHVVRDGAAFAWTSIEDADEPARAGHAGARP